MPSELILLNLFAGSLSSSEGTPVLPRCACTAGFWWLRQSCHWHWTEVTPPPGESQWRRRAREEAFLFLSPVFRQVSSTPPEAGCPLFIHRQWQSFIIPRLGSTINYKININQIRIDCKSLHNHAEKTLSFSSNLHLGLSSVMVAPWTIWSTLDNSWDVGIFISRPRLSFSSTFLFGSNGENLSRLKWAIKRANLLLWVCGTNKNGAFVSFGRFTVFDCTREKN